MITSIEKMKLEKKNQYKGIGFTIRKVGIGDGIQFTSLPENFFLATGEKLIDVSQPWYLENNPYIIRNATPRKIIELWNYPKQYEWPKIRNAVYLNNAEIHCSVVEVKDPKLIRPRLYRYENYPFYERNMILFHPFGKSHGALPDQVIDHVLKKYKNQNEFILMQVGSMADPDIGIPRIYTDTLWNLAERIAQCRMFIGVDSGPAWIAACYPDVVVKKIRTKFQFGFCEPKDWTPLDIRNEHSYWDDQGLFKIYNCFEKDMGFTESFRKI
jgi:hypothetical protein